MFLKITFRCDSSGCQNNVSFQPLDNLVSAGKNSQIKARKSEHGFGFKRRMLNMILSSKSRPGNNVPFNALCFAQTAFRETKSSDA